MRTDQTDLAHAAPALDRTLRLMRDELNDTVTDDDLLGALTGTEVALVAGEEVLKSHAAQTAFVAAALLMARSGHMVYLVAPNVPLLGPQPPLTEDRLLDGLLDVGRDLVPGIQYQTGVPRHEIEAVVFFGNRYWSGRATLAIYTGASPWQGWISLADETCCWPSGGWSIGALAAADLVASEAFKTSMRKLRRFASNPEIFDMLFTPTPRAVFALAPDGTPTSSELGRLDVVSGGAIAQVSLFTFARIPRAAGHVRVIEPDISELSNLNRNMLLRRSKLEMPKAHDLAEQRLGSITVTAVQARYEDPSRNEIELQPIVLVGVDDIPTRWAVQRSGPEWLAVGATSHFLAMSSFHSPELPCVGCLHPYDDPSNDPIPTVAFVSYAAGLMMATQYLRKMSNVSLENREQQVIFRPRRPERIWRSGVAARNNCPVKCPASLKQINAEQSRAVPTGNSLPTKIGTVAEARGDQLR
jgi:hypothetical protein